MIEVDGFGCLGRVEGRNQDQGSFRLLEDLGPRVSGVNYERARLDLFGICQAGIGKRGKHEAERFILGPGLYGY
jgi:hypothetical protein